MAHEKKLIPLLLTALCAWACAGTTPPVTEGVSRALAERRAAIVDSVRYDLLFTIPEEKDRPVAGSETLRFYLRSREALQLDFRPGDTGPAQLAVNGKTLSAALTKEHLLLPRSVLRKGWNCVTVDFTPSDGALNRRDDHLYTLLVPDRARTVFPCFDQPDLKATYTLTLDIPAHWTAMAEGTLLRDAERDGRRIRSYSPVGPLSTYLFSFVAGVWQTRTVHRPRDGAPMTAYYRETDPDKVAQLDDVFAEVSAALDWMEDYTGIPRPFAKYDFVVVPGFQFGGMEHPGAILFNDRRIFLGARPTTAERLSRSELITHETAHLWFGDAVTMRWFDDVWTKEVFANYFASLMSRPRFPQVDMRTRDFRNFNMLAYAEDRTAGTNAIHQQLDNLSWAGLIYGNIVYDKAPVVMRMLADLLGPEAFREGMRAYLSTYFHGNATWDELIAILDARSDLDLRAWSRSWVDGKGMPTLRSRWQGDTLVLQQEDPSGGGLTWPQRIVYDTGNGKVEAWLDGARTCVEASPGRYALPNVDGGGYGFFELDSLTTVRAMEALPEMEEGITRLSLLSTLYENLIRGGAVSHPDFLRLLSREIRSESDPIVSGAALSILGELSLHGPLAGSPAVERLLCSVTEDGALRMETRQTAFRHLLAIWRSDETTRKIAEAFLKEKGLNNLEFNDRDVFSMACELAVRLPERYAEFGTLQRERLAQSSPDDQDEFSFVYQAVNPDKARRDSLFRALLKAENRRIEPWTQTALAYLNHPLRQESATDYIRPALEVLEEIQRTGDIFFPKNWCNALLRGHDSPQAAAAVTDFLEARPDFPPLLRNKLLQSADHLLRTFDDHHQ